MAAATKVPTVEGMNFIAFILLGLIAGAIARSILKLEGGWLASLLTGAAGAIVGGWIGELIFNRGTGGFFSLWSWVLAIGGSLLVLWVYGKVTAKK